MAERILIVDDEEVNRELLEALLTEAGYAVTLAADGPSALAQATASPPDLILLDVLMPGMSGLDVCAQLKQASITAEVPVIVVTVVGQVATREAALTSGADDFVRKPIRPDDLRARVTAMLKVRRIRQELDRTLAYLHELEATRHAQRHAALTQVVAVESARQPLLPTPLPVLLVDDDVLTREFYGDLLAEHGFHVFAASSGAEGLEVAMRHSLDAAVLDIMMPGMSGVEVLEHLHRQDPDLPVIMLTGRPTSQHAIAALKLGAFDFIVKGLDHSLVVLAVHRAIRHRRDVVKRKEEVEHLEERIRILEERLREVTLGCGEKPSGCLDR